MPFLMREEEVDELIIAVLRRVPVAYVKDAISHMEHRIMSELSDINDRIDQVVNQNNILKAALDANTADIRDAISLLHQTNAETVTPAQLAAIRDRLDGVVTANKQAVDEATGLDAEWDASRQPAPDQAFDGSAPAVPAEPAPDQAPPASTTPAPVDDVPADVTPTTGLFPSTGDTVGTPPANPENVQPAGSSATSVPADAETDQGAQSINPETKQPLDGQPPAP